MSRLQCIPSTAACFIFVHWQQAPRGIFHKKRPAVSRGPFSSVSSNTCLSRRTFSVDLFLVVEQSESGECHDHIVLVAGLDDIVVTDGAACFRYILNTALASSLDVVAEREESV